MMRRILLMSSPTSDGIKKIFNVGFEEKIFGYLPVDGESTPEKYINEWMGYAKEYGAKFNYINNSSAEQNFDMEREKLLRCNICFISGGNTFLLLRNLRRSGLDKILSKFVHKEEYLLAGASAGALVMTPSIAVCDQPGFDRNKVGLKELTGLGLVNFEIWPHYDVGKHQELLEIYRNAAQYPVKVIKDGEYIVINNSTINN